jgi:hypothetical protein
MTRLATQRLNMMASSSSFQVKLQSQETQVEEGMEYCKGDDKLQANAIQSHQSSAERIDLFEHQPILAVLDDALIEFLTLKKKQASHDEKIRK